jgi:tRNA-dihydrouridine synthase 2
VIFQIGSSDPELAVQAARVVAQDVSGIDLNCGCPKPFSTHAGMGAALLSTPDLLLSIIRALIAAIPLPISAKIRLLPTRAETSHLAARILRTGVRNLTVHCRTRDMRPRERAIHDRLAEVVALGRRRGISVTCNGDGEGWENWEAIKTATGEC